jgi:ribosomal protein S18 acetylase RimI-like enzyme
VEIAGDYVINGATIAVRRADAADEGFLRSLFEATKADELGLGDLPARMRERLLGQQWAARRTGYATDFGGAGQYVLVEGAVPIGQVLLHRREGVELRIVDISVTAAARGNGIGGHLLGVLATAADAAHLPLRLSVAPTNPAVHLYRRAGFVTVQQNEVALEMEIPQAGAG